MWIAIAFAEQLPTVSITSPANNATVSGNLDIIVNYSISAGEVHSLVLSAAGNDVQTVAVHQQTGSFTFQLNTTAYPNDRLAIKVKAFSADPNSGHYSWAGKSVIVDNAIHDITPPVITITAPQNDSISNSENVGISATLVDDFGVDVGSVVVKFDGANIVYVRLHYIRVTSSIE